MDNDINITDDTIAEMETLPVKKAIRKDITDTQSDVSAEEYREFKTPLPMHTLTQTSPFIYQVTFVSCTTVFSFPPIHEQ